MQQGCLVSTAAAYSGACFMLQSIGEAGTVSLRAASPSIAMIKLNDTQIAGIAPMLQKSTYKN